MLNNYLHRVYIALEGVLHTHNGLCVGYKQALRRFMEGTHTEGSLSQPSSLPREDCVDLLYMNKQERILMGAKS